MGEWWNWQTRQIQVLVFTADVRVQVPPRPPKPDTNYDTTGIMIGVLFFYTCLQEAKREMEFRKVFDTIPEQFDKYRPHYSGELFADLIAYAGINPSKTVLELGPGTGEATEPILNTDCDYNAIELGEHLFEMMKRKYGQYQNFTIVNDDFITHDFGCQKFDMIYSAATIQWIPEEVAFSKTFELLKPGGTLAMMLIKGDYKTPNEDLFNKIQNVYSEYFKPEIEYKHGSFKYTNAPNYGYVDFEKREYYGKREYTADEYVAFCGTHCDHIVIPEPYRSMFFNGLKEAVLEAGNKIVFHDTFILFLTKKQLYSQVS